MDSVVEEFTVPVEPQRRRLQPYHWSELHLRPKREPMIKGILDRGASSLLYGETNSGKTFVGLDMGVHVAHSPSWRDHKVRQGIVCYIAAEGGLGLEERLTAYRLHHDINETGVPLYILPASVDLCSSDADTTEMIDELKRLGHVEFIIIDTLSRVLAGGNENAPDDMGAFVQNLDKIRGAIGAHIMVIHHTGKDGARGARGHSLLRAAMDTEIEVTNAAGIITVAITKQRDYATDGSFVFKLESVEIGRDEDNEAITSCVLVPMESSAAPKVEKKLTPRQQNAMKALHNHFAQPEAPPLTFSKFDSLMLNKGVFDEGTLRQRFSDLRNQLSAKMLIVISDQKITLPKPKWMPEKTADTKADTLI